MVASQGHGSGVNKGGGCSAPRRVSLEIPIPIERDGSEEINVKKGELRGA